MIIKFQSYLNESITNKLKFNFEEESCKFNNQKDFEDHLKKLMIDKNADVPVFLANNFVRKKIKIVDVNVSKNSRITLFTDKGNTYTGRYSGSDDVNIYILPNDLSNNDVIFKRPDIDPYGEENWDDDIKENLMTKEKNEDKWVKCPDDYYFKMGERIKLSPCSKYQHQVGDKKKLGNIIKQNQYSDNHNNESWDVEWDVGSKFCYYWRKDLLIDKSTMEKWEKNKEKLRLKYKDIDPYGEENW